MTTANDRVRAAHAELLRCVRKVLDLHALGDEYRNDSLDQLAANAFLYAYSVRLARQVCSFAQLLDDLPGVGEAGEAFRALRPLCCDIVGAHTWAESEAAPRAEKVMCQATVCGTGYDLARRISRMDCPTAGGW